MRKFSVILSTVAVLASSALAADDARLLIERARTTAAKENKAVFVSFHASW